MTAAPHRLHAVTGHAHNKGGCLVVCQATLHGPQDTSVRTLIPVTGTGGPHVAVRIGPILLLVADRQAMTSLLDAWVHADRLAAAAFEQTTSH
ncbi:hypothetical protein [Pedococcus sp. 5OH_020]|uniref:hypothetical protein n=1 Tax=Pedococcus sp. 5OH_020 TaxID=2989814 RepID=UPI0022E9C824|nr:hypothetical protein [Pedococcus sp. 5OH_020]